LLRSKFASPVPVSMATSFDPVFTTTGEYGIVILSFSIYAAASATFTSSFFMLVTKVSGSGNVFCPSVTTVTS
jgi:hypothetical protein